MSKDLQEQWIIQVVVEGGLVQDVLGVPKNTIVQVIDFDNIENEDRVRFRGEKKIYSCSVADYEHIPGDQPSYEVLTPDAKEDE